MLDIHVPALELNKQVKGESLNLLKYIDDNFDGPELLPHVRDKYTCSLFSVELKFAFLMY